ncbi:MAG: ArnT family glycosyltransferase [Patescibacteria group bacterium]
MKKILSVLTILFLGLAIRLVGINWDQGSFLHPDERFLVMVVESLNIPDSFSAYLSIDSPLQVRNTSYSFYVYGSFPVVLTKLISHFLIDQPSFASITNLGRYLTIILETLNILLVYKLAEFITKKHQLSFKLPLWSSLFYAFSVLPIQLSHFYTVDPFLTFFCLLALLLITKITKKRGVFYLIAAGVSFGLALASKLSAVFFSPLLGFFMISLVFHPQQKTKTIGQLISYGLLFSLATYLSLRLFNPEYFAFASWLKPTISPQLIRNLDVLKSWTNSTANYPPSMQWLERTQVLFSLKNIFFFGLGIWQSTFILIGLYWIISKKIKSLLGIVVSWLVGFIIFQGFQFVQSLRYFYFLYPWFAIIGAIGISWLQQVKKIKNNLFVFNLLFISLILLWPLMFLKIFLVDHSRVSATYWIRENIDPQKKIIYEYWDDALPLGYAPGKHVAYQTEPISIFDQDSDQKWQKINQQLETADFYILSSNRGWASLSRLPDKYPTTAQFYQDLFAGRTNYYFEKSFQTKPSLDWLGINLTLDDGWAEEAFTVYDHPTVLIFKKKLD